MEKFPADQKKTSGIAKWLKTSTALAGAVALGYLGTHQEKKEATHPEATGGLAALSPAKYKDMQDRLQGVKVTEYFAHVLAGKDPTPQESEARARQIAERSGVKELSGIRIICENGVPVEIHVNNMPVRIDPTLYTETELSRINGETAPTNIALERVRDSLRKGDISPKAEKNTPSGKAFIGSPDDF